MGQSGRRISTPYSVLCFRAATHIPESHVPQSDSLIIDFRPIDLRSLHLPTLYLGSPASPLRACQGCHPTKASNHKRANVDGDSVITITSNRSKA